MEDDLQPIGDNQALIAFAKSQVPLEQLVVKDPHGIAPDTTVAILPEGKEAHDLERFVAGLRLRPIRRKGTATMNALNSFIAHVKRFMDEGSALFAKPDPKAPTLTAVLNYHPEGNADPRHGDHRTHYPFPIDKAWKTWLDRNKVGMGQADFAEFIEDNIADVIPPPDYFTTAAPMPLEASQADRELRIFLDTIGGRIATPAELVKLSRGLQVHESSKVTNAIRLESGEGQIQYETEHKDANGEKLSIPSLFLIAIPPFHLGERYRLPVRLRYRLAGGKLAWFFEIYRLDESFDHAVREAAAKAQTETGLPLFIGSPE